jgi:prevent-host-death family protein
MKHVGAYEAKTHLARLLDEVAAGETITITKHGVAVAVLTAPPPGRESAATAASDLKEFRTAHRLRGVTIRELVEDGRRT